eukprot:scaffold4184_cov120-Isochrysis_galbana.AAC.11
MKYGMLTTGGMRQAGRSTEMTALCAVPAPSGSGTKEIIRSEKAEPDGLPHALRHEPHRPLHVVCGGRVGSRRVLTAKGALLGVGLGQNARLGDDSRGQHLVQEGSLGRDELRGQDVVVVSRVPVGIPVEAAARRACPGEQDCVEEELEQRDCEHPVPKVGVTQPLGVGAAG